MITNYCRTREGKTSEIESEVVAQYKNKYEGFAQSVIYERL